MVVLKDTMKEAVNIVNFIRSRALYHRQFRALLEEDDGDYVDIIYHCNIRWLSNGVVINRIWELKDKIQEFYQSKQEPCMLCDTGFCVRLTYLGDILSHLNNLNKQIQGQNNSSCDLWRCLKIFMRNLKLFRARFDENQISAEHFPLLHEFTSKYPDQRLLCNAEFVAGISALEADLDNRFSDFRKHNEELHLVSEPHLVKPETTPDKLQFELLQQAKILYLVDY